MEGSSNSKNSHTHDGCGHNHGGHGHSHGGHSHCHGDHGHSHGDMEHSISEDERNELLHYRNIVASFANYENYTTKFIQRLEHQYQLLPDHHKQFLPEMNDKFKHMRSACKLNSRFIKQIIANERIFENNDLGLGLNPDDEVEISSLNMDKVVGTLRQFVREWSKEGEAERNGSYQPILDALQAELPVDPNNLYQYKVLCPGSGLGRLPFEICKLGYNSQGNEFSFFMLIAGNFVLNRTTKEKEYTIFPNIHQVNNVESTIHQLKPCEIPDVDPSSLPSEAKFSYTAGEFIEIYRDDPDEWDAICTCFFIDTAHNIIEYIETIYHILKPGGIWINLGPLLYHYYDMPGEPSLELTLDQVLRIVKAVGFQIKTHSFQESTYTRNHGSMMKFVYNCSFFTAIKPLK